MPGHPPTPEEPPQLAEPGLQATGTAAPELLDLLRGDHDGQEEDEEDREQARRSRHQ